MRARSAPIVEISSQPLCVYGETTAISGPSPASRRATNALVIVRDVKYWFSAKISRRALAIASSCSARISITAALAAMVDAPRIVAGVRARVPTAPREIVAAHERHRIVDHDDFLMMRCAG